MSDGEPEKSSPWRRAGRHSASPFDAPSPWAAPPFQAADRAEPEPEPAEPIAEAPAPPPPPAPVEVLAAYVDEQTELSVVDDYDDAYALPVTERDPAPDRYAPTDRLPLWATPPVEPPPVQPAPAQPAPVQPAPIQPPLKPGPFVPPPAPPPRPAPVEMYAPVPVQRPAPPAPPAPPTPPPGRPAGNRLLIGLGAAVIVIAVAAVAGIAFVTLRSSTRHDDSPTAGIADAVAAIAGARGTRAAMTFGDRNGTLVDAEFTMTAAGLGTGTVSDPGGGRAEVRTNGTRTVVRADVNWWSRRAPAQASALADKWILPKDGLILPIDIGRALTPKGLAESVRFAASGSPKAAGTVPWLGRDADVLDNGDWLLVKARTEPRSVVWFGGHLSGFGPLQPAGLHGGRGGLLPLPDATGGRFRPAYQPYNVPPYVGVTLSTADDATLAQVEQAVGEVLPPPDRAGAPGAPAPPASQEHVRLTAPSFVTQADDGDCTGQRCTWSVKVTNKGSAPCDATAIASVSPGMAPVTTHLGVIDPGQSASTPSMTYDKAAGQQSKAAQVYCPALDGLDPAPRRRLAALQFDPSASPKVGALDPALQTVLLNAADAMTRGRTGTMTDQDRQQFLAALDLTIAGQLIPEVRAITESGRVENPDALIGVLRNASGAAEASLQLPLRRELEFAANLLRNDPSAHLRLDDRTPTVTDTTTNRIYRLAAVTGDRLLPDRPANAPTGLSTILVVYLEPTRPEHDLDRPGFARVLHDPRHAPAAGDTLCPNRQPAMTELVLVNRHGEQRWTAAQLHELADACP
ncbi:hypothetical protein [Dactylosporangium matsuzakiense]|uniref:hypothetical protein n=1 Tax=Dactylosporangium matsuzakiense TaxID=53360 RepID=UPI00220F25C6|nr:hypothetical protein [Dactylosporangium matsuzakiense]UWZ47723.1 hypothetical protein Dmats_15755 [Dactylosporangium matsuzakiense]